MESIGEAFTGGYSGELAADTNRPIFHLRTKDLNQVADMRRSLGGTKYQVYDPDSHLVATIKPPLGSFIPELKIEDSEGKTIANCLCTADDFKLLTLEGSVAAIVTKTQGSAVNYKIELDDTPTPPLLIYCHVIATDNLSYWVTLRDRVSRSAGRGKHRGIGPNR